MQLKSIAYRTFFTALKFLSKANYLLIRENHLVPEAFLS